MQNLDYSHRKAGCSLHLLDAEGRALKNTKIRFKQTSHSFLFGGGAFDFIPFVNAEPEGEQYKRLKLITDQYLDLYNYGTLPFYWGNFEPQEGNVQTLPLLKTAKYLKDQGVTVKGHPLCWHTVCADWLMQYDNDTILKKQLARIDREMTNFKGVIDMWDVINEVVIMPIFDKYDNAITRICKDKGRIGLIREVFAKAKESNPEATLLLNDFNTSISYEILIDGCLEAGIPIDVIGIQSHQHQGYWGREKVEEVLHRFEHFGLPIHFTENTLISGDLMPSYIEDLNDWQVENWPSTPEGESRQQKEMEEMYRLLFAHPLVTGITGWDFVDGAWLGAPSGIIRKDGTAKPAYYKLKELIKGEWWTEREFVTDENGNVFVEGYKGTYELSYGDDNMGDKLHKAKFSLQNNMSGGEIILK